MVKIPLSPANRRTAENFMRQCPNQQKANQIFLNTLAVCAVEFYFKCLGIKTEVEASYSWNPSKQSFLDVADLYVKKLGRLECRPVGSDTRICELPLEVRQDRIGYLVVLIDESFRKATVLGFSQTALGGNLEISRLQTLADLFDHLESLRLAKKARVRVNLSQWFDDIFDTDWYSQQLTVAYRSVPHSQEVAVEAVKQIDLGMEALELRVGLKPEAEEKIGIRVQLHPSQRNYLPCNLRLALLSESGITVREVYARNQDNFIQLKRFKCLPGKSFSIQVGFNYVNLTEDFILEPLTGRRLWLS